VRRCGEEDELDEGDGSVAETGRFAVKLQFEREKSATEARSRRRNWHSL
jgi:hypothetical protein